MAKRITSDSRVRICVSLDGIHKPENITMTAGQWNGLCVALYNAAETLKAKGCNALAEPYEKASDRITAILTMKGYYKE